jgi:aryl sulfotransferase
MTESVEWPKKTRELHNHHFDSTIWNDLSFRDDDIIISTYAKAGTTWMQQIVGQLLFDGDPDLEVAEMSPWLDLRVPPKEVKLPLVEAQTHRRFLKTHLPVDALRFSPKAGPPPTDVGQCWRDWMDRDGHPFWPFWENVRSWWQVRDLPNVKLVHFANLKRDMPGESRRISGFLDIPIREARWEAILEHCSFAWMKKNATKTVPLGGAFWDAGAEVFIHKGLNGRWKDTLTAEESAEYEGRAEAELGAECARWLASGEGID